MDEQGRKMSKSLGNVVNPADVVQSGEVGSMESFFDDDDDKDKYDSNNGGYDNDSDDDDDDTQYTLKNNESYGVDVLRTWVGSSGLDPSVSIGKNVLEEAKQKLFRVTLPCVCVCV